VKLDLHGLPGSQNGWNHSGRQGPIGWLNGTDGDLNAQRSLDLHDQLSKFFAQPRYANVIGIYGLVNEPKMISLPLDPVLNWTTHAIDIVRGNGLQQWIAVADGFLGLPKWQGQLSGEKNVVLDAHQYVIFNTGQIGMDHTAKLNYACEGWTGQMQQSTNTATG
jgi:glucan 1,3-beta-glucosidase